MNPAISSCGQEPTSGRKLFAVLTDSFGSLPAQHELESTSFALVLALPSGSEPISIECARAWIDRGACWVLAWGEHAEDVEETFDYACFIPEVGAALPHTVMTTCHLEETLDEVLSFAVFQIEAADDFGRSIDAVVAVTTSPEVHQRCTAWLLSPKPEEGYGA